MQFASLIEKIEASVEQEIANKNPAFMHFYNEKDANYPPWVVSMSITFGNISHLYKFLKDKVKNNIAREFNLMPNILSAYLRTLSQVRNVCAHGGRVYDIKFINTIKIPTAYGSRFNHKLGAVIYILKSLLDETDFSQFNYEFESELSKLEHCIKSIDIQKIYGLMGVPAEPEIRREAFGAVKEEKFLSQEEFYFVLNEFINPLIPQKVEIKPVTKDDSNQEHKPVIYDSKNGMLLFSQSATEDFEYYIEIPNSDSRFRTIYQNISDHYIFFMSSLKRIWNVSKNGFSSNEFSDTFFSKLCEQAYEMAICNLLFRKRTDQAEKNLDEAIKAYNENGQKKYGAEKEEIAKRRNKADAIIKKEAYGAKTLCKIIDHLEEWSLKTYEGQKKTFGILINRG